MDEIDLIFDRLSHSKFRSSFKLKSGELEYLNQKGIDLVMDHALEFLENRIVPAYPANDGKQTPYSNHPVFVGPACHGNLLQGLYTKMA